MFEILSDLAWPDSLAADLARRLVVKSHPVAFTVDAEGADDFFPV